MSDVTTLSVVNDMLALLGELPVNDLDDDHALIPRALSQLKTTNELEQGPGYYFNTEFPTLVAQTTGRIILPDDCISVDLLATSPRVGQRGGYLYNMDDSTYTWEAGKTYRCIMKRLVAFDDLPGPPKGYIRARALQDFNTNIVGDTTKNTTLKEDVRIARIQMMKEHIRYVGANLLYTPSVLAKLGNMIGTKANMLYGPSYNRLFPAGRT